MSIKKNRSEVHYQSLTPKKNHFCFEIPEEKPNKQRKRLSFLLTSLNLVYSDTKKKQAQIHQRYFQKSYKNYIKISDIRKDLTQKSTKIWNKALTSAKQASTLLQLNKAIDLANKAVQLRVQSQNRYALEQTIWK